jgi:hypothetical protein
MSGDATPQRVVDFTTSTISIREADYWQLSTKARAMLQTYGTLQPPRTDGFLYFEVASYRVDEILRATQKA